MSGANDATPSRRRADQGLYASQRQQVLLRTVRGTGRVDAAAAAEELNVSTETIRKDLIGLERLGLLRRVHGGAVAVDELSFEPSVSARTEFMDEKRRIARAALDELPQEGTLFFDNGSTTSRLAEVFPSDRELTVFTNSLPIALMLVNRPRLTVHTLGGRVRGRTLAEVDNWAVRALSELRVDVAFLGTNGLSVERGLTTPDGAEAAVKRMMYGAARRRILLADHSKVGHVSMLKYADLSDVDLLITDDGVDDRELKKLRAAGLAVRCV
ncbi:DeoR/GlpR family DNA-binding transcription regulator [Actinomadura chibensis]|uniref:Lactose phosphotransferase system repressor n=1 Tax=Actinomadura chibensis TaxID=392828 RepID=A0A5D0NMU1_9ACTN|nr:DeoR/GlpR family DNA-binding transcription regulator [Actinomadura chibensis]TYB45588.1 DeoR/GlpR transcriptional regulator [Actinomadura chibensis]